MADKETPATLEGVLSVAIAAREQSKANSEQNVRMEAAITRLAESTEKGFANLREKTAPNFATMLGLASIILMVVFGIAAPVAYYFNHSIDFLSQNIQTTAETLARSSAMVQSANDRRLNKLEEWDGYGIRSDLDELRIRRMKEH